MASKSNIEWTGHTWNPLAGCTVLTPGCKRCYAMRMAARLEKMGQELYAGLTEPSKAGPVWTGVMRRASREVLLAPLRRRKPTTYFVNSMSDLFHENVPDEWIDEVFAVMALCPQHTFQVLTKRADRMRDYMRQYRGASHWMDKMRELAPPPNGHGVLLSVDGGVLRNVWLGVSTERQKEADERIPLLLQTPAAVRFISAEPLLGPIDLIGTFCRFKDGPDKRHCEVRIGDQLINWVIVGGESGHGARPMHPDWARGLRDQCAAAGVAFFFKQWGEYVPTLDREAAQYTVSDAAWMRVGKRAAGRLLDGIEHNGMPGIAA